MKTTANLSTFATSSLGALFLCSPTMTPLTFPGCPRLQNPSSRPHRDHCPNPLRGIPFEAASRIEGPSRHSRFVIISPLHIRIFMYTAVLSSYSVLLIPLLFVLLSGYGLGWSTCLTIYSTLHLCDEYAPYVVVLLTKSCTLPCSAFDVW